MSPAIRFYRDQSHLPRVQAGPEHNTLADYLESDLQDHATTVELLGFIKKTAEERQEISGNSYTLIRSRDQITLENLFDDDQPLYALPISKFQQLLAAWADFLNNSNLMSIVPDF